MRDPERRVRAATPPDVRVHPPRQSKAPPLRSRQSQAIAERNDRQHKTDNEVRGRMRNRMFDFLVRDVRFWV